MKKQTKQQTKIFFIGDYNNGVYKYFDTLAEAQAAYQQDTEAGAKIQIESGDERDYEEVYNESLDFHFFGSCDADKNNEIILS